MNPGHRYGWVWFLACAAGLAWPAAARAQAPQIGHCFPPQLQPGHAAEIGISGTNLAGVTSLMLDFPAQVSLPTTPPHQANGKDNGSVLFQIDVPARTPVGPHLVRVVGPRGVSNAKVLWVDDLPPVTEKEPNGPPGPPQRISTPACVNGVVMPEDIDQYVIHAAAGQTLSFEAVAQRLMAPLDTVIRLLDAQGRELAYSDDAVGLGTDSRLSYTFARAGDYVIELRDVTYAGSADAVYCLRIGDFPCPTVFDPAGGRRGSRVKVRPVGPRARQVGPLVIAVPATSPADRIQRAVRGRLPFASSPVNFAVGRYPEVAEVEPNDDLQKPQRLTWPATINGRFDRAGDADRYRITARAGERLLLSVETRRLGSAADAVMTIARPDGSEIASNDDLGDHDATIDFRAPASGDYVVTLEDLNHRGGPEFVYRLTIAPFEPRFSVLPTTDRLIIPRGGAAPLMVNLTRLDTPGPMEVTALDLPPGITVNPGYAGPGQATVALTVSAAPAAPQGAWPLHLVGRAVVAGRVVQRPASLAAARLPELGNNKIALDHLPLDALRSMVAAAVAGPAASLQAKVETPDLIPGMTAAATVVVRRPADDQDKGAVELKVLDKMPPPTPLSLLPPGITVQARPIPAGKDRIQVPIALAASVGPGKYTVVLQGTTSIKKQKSDLTAPALVVEVHPTFELALEPGPRRLVAGGKLPLAVRLTRHGTFKAAVQVAAKNLPAGVTARPLTLAPGKDRGTIELTAASTAAPASIKNLSVIGAAAGTPGATAAETTLELTPSPRIPDRGLFPR